MFRADYAVTGLKAQARRGASKKLHGGGARGGASYAAHK
jgi:hypothetical protein